MLFLQGSLSSRVGGWRTNPLFLCYVTCEDVVALSDGSLPRNPVSEHGPKAAVGALVLGPVVRVMSVHRHRLPRAGSSRHVRLVVELRLANCRRLQTRNRKSCRRHQ